MEKYTKLRNACFEASKAFQKLNDPAYEEIREKLDFCVGSYDFDRNPSGLIEYGHKAVDQLKKAKAKYPRKFAKKVITDLEKQLREA